MTWIAVALGGALGSMARHFINLELAHRLEKSVPHATFVVNVLGCLIIGILSARIASGKLVMTATMRTFVFVGVLGGFTTFSTFGLDTFTLAHGGDHTTAFLNVAGQIGLGIGAVFLGYHIAL